MTLDHRTKILDKLAKLQAAQEGEAELGNTEAAEAFASKICQMLNEYELAASDIEYAKAVDKDPVIKVYVNVSKYGVKSSNIRVDWQVMLAMGITEAHLCKMLIVPRSNNIYIIGAQAHATVAEYVLGVMLPFVEKTSKRAELLYWKSTGSGRGEDNKAKGYRAAWINGFTYRIRERFLEIKKAAVEASGLTQEMGLMRLTNSLERVSSYMKDMGTRTARPLHMRNTANTAGRQDGKTQANSYNLGQKAVGGSMGKREIA